MNGSGELTKGIRVCGFISGAYLALSYVIGIVFFLGILRYPDIATVSDKVVLVAEKGPMLFLANIVTYVLFGPALILFIIALTSAFPGERPFIVKFSAVVGYVWAGSLIASGMISNAAIEAVTRIAHADPDRASSIWETVEIVTTGIGNGNGEILGGLMTIGFSLAILTLKVKGRGIGVFGLITGLAGLLSVLPPLEFLTGVFGILQLVWFLLIAASFLSRQKDAVR